MEKQLDNYGLLEGDLRPVSTYPDRQSMYGVYDLAENAWEWVGSLNRPYPYRPDDGRESLTEIGKRVLRGGSWRSEPEFLRAFFRYEADQTTADLDIGFRCTKSAETP